LKNSQIHIFGRLLVDIFLLEVVYGSLSLLNPHLVILIFSYKLIYLPNIYAADYTSF